MSQTSGNQTRQFLFWTLANILGFSALAIILLLLPSIMLIRNMILPNLIITLPISIAQWIVLRRIAPISALWILTTPVGVILAVLCFQNIPQILLPEGVDEHILVLTTLYLVMGFTIGLPQWLVLRRQFSKSSIWLLGSSLSLPVGFGLVLATDLINQAEITAYLVVGLVYILITGVTLTRMLSRRSPPQSQPNLAV